MPPLVRAALIAAACAAIAVALARPTRSVRVGTPAVPSASQRSPVAPCPRGTLPDANVCIPVPAASAR